MRLDGILKFVACGEPLSTWPSLQVSYQIKMSKTPHFRLWDGLLSIWYSLRHDHESKPRLAFYFKYFGMLWGDYHKFPNKLSLVLPSARFQKHYAVLFSKNELDFLTHIWTFGRCSDHSGHVQLTVPLLRLQIRADNCRCCGSNAITWRGDLVLVCFVLA